MESEVATVISDLHYGDSDDIEAEIVVSTTALYDGKESVLLFGGYTTRQPNPILEFNISSKLVSIPSSISTTFPTLYFKPASVSKGYFIGGIGKRPEIDGTYYPTNGIIK
jgi:hypothetical protein